MGRMTEARPDGTGKPPSNPPPEPPSEGARRGGWILILVGVVLFLVALVLVFLF